MTGSEGVVTGYLLLVIGLFRIPDWWGWLLVICYWSVYGSLELVRELG